MASENVESRRTIAKAIGVVVGVIALIVPIALVVGLVAFVYTYATVQIPAASDLRPSQDAVIYDAKGGVIAEIPFENRRVIKYDQIPKNMVEAIKAAEDRGFDSNDGFSIRGLSRAFIGQLPGQQYAGGGSTITQQYVKNVVVGDEATGLAGYKRKFKELAISMKMSKQWSKDDIMAGYLNTIYFGRGAYGVASAAKTYFGKDITSDRCAKDQPNHCLTESEAAMLAGIIRGPSFYDPDTNREGAENRWNYVLNGMVDTGALTKEDRDKQVFPKIVTAASDSRAAGPNGLIKTQVEAELTKLGISQETLRTGGLKIYTSIKPQVQKAAEQAACRAKNPDNPGRTCPNGLLTSQPKTLRTAVVSINPKTGGVEGYYGGPDGNGTDYAQAGLQTGSTFKVFALAAALTHDIPLSRVYSSAPYTASGGVTVNNSDGDSCGSCNLATATKRSLNTVFYRLMDDLPGGANEVAETAYKAGVAREFTGNSSPLSYPEDKGNSQGGVVLGQYPSRVIDMASAYATFAASGVYREPYFVEKVVDSDGDEIYKRDKNPGKRVFSAAVADNVTAALEPIPSVDGNSLSGRDSAGKTGTAQFNETGQNKDAWMIGYTPQLSTAVWVGGENAKHQPVPIVNSWGGAIYGAGLPGSIWRTVMNNALDGQDSVDFPTPAAVGGQAGVPYEPPPTSYYPETSSRPRTRTPGGGGNGGGNGGGGNGGGGMTIPGLPGVTIPGVPGNNGGGGNTIEPEEPGNGGGGNTGGGNTGGGDDDSEYGSNSGQQERQVPSR